jgi:hypothetical protein
MTADNTKTLVAELRDLGKSYHPTSVQRRIMFSAADVISDVRNRAPVGSLHEVFRAHAVGWISLNRALETVKDWSEGKPFELPAVSDSHRREVIADLVTKFLAWPLPQSVASDLCVTDRSYQFPRSGTNLLTADEATQMITHLLESLSAEITALREGGDVGLETTWRRVADAAILDRPLPIGARLYLRPSSASELAEVVAWLRDPYNFEPRSGLADAIKRGEHLRALAPSAGEGETK